jgi:hypothetical protein
MSTAATNQGQSFLNLMSENDFQECCAESISLAVQEAERLSVPLGAPSSTVDQKVRAILLASGIRFSVTSGYLEVGIRVVSLALAMLGVRPQPDDIRRVLEMSLHR